MHLVVLQLQLLIFLFDYMLKDLFLVVELRFLLINVSLAFTLHQLDLIFYLLCGVAAASAQIYFASASATPMIGASGAIAGVLGAYLILFPHARIASLVPIFFIFTLVELPAVVFLGLWFVMQLFSGWLALQGAVTNNVAWWAHVGGFAFGLITVHLFAGRR